MASFENAKGQAVVEALIKAIADNKQYLSDIDGAIGDGDHGVNMNKGFALCGEDLSAQGGDLTYCLRTLSRRLMNDIGGSMGPLYGTFFRAMAKVCAGAPTIDEQAYLAMLEAAEAGIRDIGGAQVGDKTLIDALTPAVAAFKAELEAGEKFPEALDKLDEAAAKGRDSTIDMVAKLGRASRLGERSRGAVDAGATSCCLILQTMSESVKQLL